MIIIIIIILIIILVDSHSEQWRGDSSIWFGVSQYMWIQSQWKGGVKKCTLCLLIIHEKPIATHVFMYSSIHLRVHNNV